MSTTLEQDQTLYHFNRSLIAHDDLFHFLTLGHAAPKPQIVENYKDWLTRYDPSFQTHFPVSEDGIIKASFSFSAGDFSPERMEAVITAAEALSHRQGPGALSVEIRDSGYKKMILLFKDNNSAALITEKHQSPTGQASLPERNTGSVVAMLQMASYLKNMPSMD